MTSYLRILVVGMLLAGTNAQAFAQSPERAQIEQRFTAFAEFTQDMAIDSIISYTYPKLFDFATADMIATQFAQIAADTNMQITFELPQLDSLSSSIFSYEGASYAMVYYHAPMKMTMLSAEYREKNFMERIGQLLAAQYGIENISGNLKQYRFRVDAAKRMMAIRAAAGAPWYFLEYNEGNAMLLNTLIAEEVRDHFGLE
jgi:hypothetical protein